MAVDLSSPAIRWLPLVEFAWGPSERDKARYVRSEQNVIVASRVYTADPRISWKFRQPRHGGTRDSVLRLTMHKDTEPLVFMQTERFSPVEVTVSETRADDLTQTRCVFVGIIGRTILRAGGKSDLMEADIHSRKQRMKDVPLGVVATDRCAWTFRDFTCLFSPTQFVDTTPRVTLIDNNFIELDSLVNNSQVGGGNGLYTRGFVERRRLRIMIRNHIVSSNPPRLNLVHAAPTIWQDQIVTVSAGCDKTIPDCEFYGRQESFGGFGLRMPKHMPIIEDESTCA